MMNWAEAIVKRDTSVFLVPSQTSTDDRLSLLELQNLVRDHVSSYVYVEVGSHVGGSIFPHLVDDRCREIVSIDPRPSSQPDERGGKRFAYEGNSAERMMETLAAEGVSTQKVRSVALVAWDAVHCGLVPYFDLAFIDGEHTNTAVVSDFLALLNMAHPRAALIAFHDANILGPALMIAEKILQDKGRAYVARRLKDTLFVVALGAMIPALGRFPS